MFERQTARLFEAYAYVPWWFGGLRLTERQAGDDNTNYFFLTEVHLAELRKKSSAASSKRCSDRTATVFSV